jgi:alkylation response protein AidB-like acyl-CoA dehydrogenase
MNLNPEPEEERFRDELRTWLLANAPAPWTSKSASEEDNHDLVEYLRDWQRRVYNGGWAGLSWPEEYGGRGASVIEQAIFNEELARSGAPPLINVIGLAMAGPTIIALGTEEQKKRYLPPILSGEEIWCQGFSEPNSGSDVASLTTKAVRDGDDFVVSGQKIWTSYAHYSKWCLLLVRTDASGPKHKGITCLLLDMKSPGVEVRPLRQITGEAGFNEVFFDNVRVPATQVLGKVDEGWKVAITILMNERANSGTGSYVTFRRILDELIQRSREMVGSRGRAADDPLTRQDLAQTYIELEIFRLNSSRALTRISKEGIPGPEGSILKLCYSETYQRMMQRAMQALGPYAQLTGFDGGRWGYNYLRSRSSTIAAGTSEILRNIIAERVLGLPKSY